MSEVMEIVNQTPIEIALGVDENGMTTASKLYSFLNLNQSNYSKWCKSNITENRFAEESVDFTRLVVKYESGVGIKEREDYNLTAKFAKKLSMMQKNERGEQAREYFTTVEERVKQKTVDYSQLSPELQMFQKIFNSVAQQQLEQKRLSKEVEEVKHTQTVIAETFQRTNDADDFQQWANKRLSQIAESPEFDKGCGRNNNYSMARAESYERLKHKRNCRLDDRVQKAIGRAIEERPDIKKSELKKINKLYIIANDRDLKLAYELVIKEMMIAYCVQ